MAVICDWYNRKASIIGVHYIGNWTAEENIAMSSRLNHLIESVQGRYDIVVDGLEAAYTFPTGTLWSWKQKMEMLEENRHGLSLLIYVTSSDVHRAYFEEGFKTSAAIRKHCRITNSVEEALEIIQQDRQSADV
jgi:hypothetical protein